MVGLVLDVGCGSKPKGSVNVDFFRYGFNMQEGDQKKGEFLDPKLIKNFVLADACHLPFKDNCFSLVFSSHVIEHVADPVLMFKEMSRVSCRKVVVRCPHRRGSGAKRPFHVNYLDEGFFSSILRSAVFSKQFIFSREGVFTTRLPFNVPSRFQKSLVWRGLRRVDRGLARRGINFPFEVESWSSKQVDKRLDDPVRFCVVSNDSSILDSCFKRGVSYEIGNAVVYDNPNGVGVPVFYNRYVKENVLGQPDGWHVFCHHDFVLNQELKPVLSLLDAYSVYGCAGVRGNFPLLGRIKQTDDSFQGIRLVGSEPVESLDEMCLIIHSRLFKEGLRFDEKFDFHFYGADFCMQASCNGFNVQALQLDCQHKSRTLTGDLWSASYKRCKRLFAEKYKRFLPLRTTTGVVSQEVLQ
jgi:SAM-dependent methyltransferase